MLLIGLKTVQFFLAGSGEYSAAESLSTQALAWLGKDEPTWRSEFTATQAQALAAQRKYAAATQIWQAQTQAGEPAGERRFLFRGFHGFKKWVELVSLEPMWRSASMRLPRRSGRRRGASR